MKIKVEGMGLPRSYDAWRTRAPYENEDPGIISKEDFFECTRDGSYDEEFLKYVKENDPENLEKIKAGIKDAGTAIGSAIDQDLYSWKEIAEEVFDWEAVEYYPGDMEDPDSVIDRRRDDKALGESFDFQKYLNEGWMHKTIDEAEDSNAPKVGTKAKDYAGEEVDIVDVLKLPAKQRDLDWFLNQYDDSGIMRDCYRDPEGYDFDPDEYDYYVAVEHPNLGETAVYVWGPEGVCYSGEDLKEGCHKVNELKREPKQATKSDLKGFASKEATLNRAKRAEKGNWKNSVGAFVEKHSAEIGNVSPLGKDALVNYIETKMKPELSDEAKAKVDELVNSSRSVTDLMFALYNTMLKGAGMGLHESEDQNPEDLEWKDFKHSDDFESCVDELTSYMNDLLVGGYSEDCDEIKDSETFVPSAKHYPYGRIVIECNMAYYFLGNESDDASSPVLVNYEDGNANSWEPVSEEDAKEVLYFIDRDGGANTVFFDGGIGLHEDLVSEETGEKTQQGSEVESNSKSLDDILTKFKEVSHWEEEMETFKIGEKMIATITFNCDCMVHDLDDLPDDDNIGNFSRQYGVTVIPFEYVTDSLYNGDPWDYDLRASGFILLKSSSPKLYPVQDLYESNNFFLTKLRKHIDKIAPEYSVDGSEWEDEER